MEALNKMCACDPLDTLCAKPLSRALGNYDVQCHLNVVRYWPSLMVSCTELKMFVLSFTGSV